MRKINEIIIHCTDTESTATAQSIRDYHVNVLGWSDCGYHYLIDAHGDCHVMRPVEKIGAHCVGHNANSIGIAYIGKFPNMDQIIGMQNLIKKLCKKFPDIEYLTPHKLYDKKGKTCPNFCVYKWLTLYNNY